MPSKMTFGAEDFAVCWIKSAFRHSRERFNMMNMKDNAMAAALAFPFIFSAAFLAFVAAKI